LIEEVSVQTEERPLQVLLVEDDSQSAELVVTAAEMARVNFKFTFATNGAEALDALYRRDKFVNAPVPDFVLLDLNLPLVSGREVLVQMKQDDRLNKMPVVLLTATDFFRDIQAEFGLPREFCHTKPNRFQGYIRLMTDWNARFRLEGKMRELSVS
jgi:CheY-like chemotaxis protein